MRYVLATTERVFRWYVFDLKTVSSTTYSLSEVLDLDIVPIAGDKATAKLWSEEMGLKTWRYVKL